MFKNFKRNKEISLKNGIILSFIVFVISIFFLFIPRDFSNDWFQEIVVRSICFLNLLYSSIVLILSLLTLLVLIKHNSISLKKALKEKMSSNYVYTLVYLYAIVIIGLVLYIF